MLIDNRLATDCMLEPLLVVACTGPIGEKIEVSDRVGQRQMLCQTLAKQASLGRQTERQKIAFAHRPNSFSGHEGLLMLRTVETSPDAASSCSHLRFDIWKLPVVV